MAKNEFFFTKTSTHDLPFMWAAYKQGDLRALGGDFDTDTPRDSFETFTENYLKVLSQNGVASFTLFLDKGENKITPVGLVIVWIRGRILEVCDLIWFHWSSPRNIFEAAAHFYNVWRSSVHEETGKPYKVLEFAQKRDEKFFDALVRKGILDRVGTLDGIFDSDDQCVLYTTVALPEKKRKTG